MHASTRESEVWKLLASVPDPEIPILSIVDLGIVRYVKTDDEAHVHVGLTPTYSGCPATEVIRASVQQTLRDAGFADAVIEETLSPPWSSDAITDVGRAKLAAFGIAPPPRSVSNPRHLLGLPPVQCPRCGSQQTRLVSEFGSTPCKAHYQCESCLEPFDAFKCL
jgi:ring-1,2-phenylacetyl-CoA epoxidase subunit PaaD